MAGISWRARCKNWASPKLGKAHQPGRSPGSVPRAKYLLHLLNQEAPKCTRCIYIVCVSYLESSKGEKIDNIHIISISFELGARSYFSVCVCCSDLLQKETSLPGEACDQSPPLEQVSAPSCHSLDKGQTRHGATNGILAYS